MCVGGGGKPTNPQESGGVRQEETRVINQMNCILPEDGVWAWVFTSITPLLSRLGVLGHLGPSLRARVVDGGGRLVRER